MTIQITRSDLVNAALLSNAAYETSGGLLSSLDRSVWRPLGSDPVQSGQFQNHELPVPDGLTAEQWDGYFGATASDSNFLFSFGHAQALVARNESDNSLAIAFRGSGFEDFLDDLLGGATTFLPLYNDFHYLIESVEQYILTKTITKVLVTGHSLGAVMAEWFMQEHLVPNGVEYVGVTFGSPSDQALNGVNDPRLINIGHTEDPVVNAASGADKPGARDVDIDLTYASGHPQTLLGLSALLGDYIAFGDLSEHDRQILYASTADALASSAGFETFIADAPSYRVIIGSVTAETLSGTTNKDFILGQSNNDIIYGNAGNDLLDGGSGNDRIEGGIGDDKIYGGLGTDIAVYARSLDHYHVTFQNDVVTISAIFQSPFVYEGTDTVTSVENFQFGNDVYSREKLIALLSPPSVSPGDTGDQSGATQGGYSGGGAGTVSGGSDVIPGDISSTFVIAANGQALTSAIETAGDKDYVKVYFVQGDTYHVAMQGDANHGFAALQDSFFRIRDSQNGIILSPTDAPGGDQLDYTAQYTGWHYISIGAGGSNFASLTGGYSLTVSLINAPVANGNPIANADDLSLKYGETITGNVLANDSDPDHNALSADFLSSYHTALGGTVDLLPSGVFQYIAPPSGPASAQDSFFYTSHDGAGGSASGTVYLNLSQPGSSGLFTASNDYVTVPSGGGIYHALSGNDVVFGSNYSDIIYGDDGNDFLHGLDGNDLLYGGTGDDGFVGGAGDDWFVLGPGRNQIWGDGVSVTFGGFDTADYSELSSSINVDMSQGTVTHSGISDFISDLDQLIGTDLSDFIHVYTSPLQVYGGAGNDTIVGWTLDDEFHGGAGDDELQGQDGNDRLFGDDGNDRLDGGDGNNTLDGGVGDDQVFGGIGDDYLFASPGTDRLYGGSGRDMVDYSHAPAGLTSFGTVPGWGTSTIELVEIFYATPFDDNFNNSIPLEEMHLGSGSDTVTANQVDTVYGDDGNDAIFDLNGRRAFGGSGNDLLVALGSTTELYGDDGNDQLSGSDGVNHKFYGGAGNDVLSGSNGNELLYGESGDDQINGGSGNGTLNGGFGFDRLRGQAGNDVFIFDAAALADAQASTPIFDHIADYRQGNTGHYSAAETDKIDVSGLTGGSSINGFVKVFDQGDSGTHLMVDANGATGGVHYVKMAQLDGIHEGQTVNVITNSAAPAGITVGVDSNQGYAGNFNASTDGNSDLIWVNDTTRAIKLFELNGHSSGSQIAANLSVGTLPTGWNISGIGDFNNDGNSDLLLQSNAGALKFWEMNGATVAHNLNAGALPAGWHVKGTGDFNHDNISDVVLQNDVSGAVKLWEFNGHASGAQLLHNLNVANLPSNWGIVGVGDFNGDNNDDLLLRLDTGQIKVWEMTGNGSGAQILANLNVSNLTLDWHIEGIGDFNNDGKSDMLLVNDTGALKLWEMNGATIAHNLNAGTLTSTQHVAGTGDFNGDGIDDILLRYDNGQAQLIELNGAASGNQILANLTVTTLDTGWSTQNHHYDLV